MRVATTIGQLYLVPSNQDVVAASILHYQQDRRKPLFSQVDGKNTLTVGFGSKRRSGDVHIENSLPELVRTEGFWRQGLDLVGRTACTQEE
jgi:hypothetical protein